MRNSETPAPTAFTSRRDPVRDGGCARRRVPEPVGREGRGTTAGTLRSYGSRSRREVQTIVHTIASVVVAYAVRAYERGNAEHASPDSVECPGVAPIEARWLKAGKQFLGLAQRSATPANNDASRFAWRSIRTGNSTTRTRVFRVGGVVGQTAVERRRLAVHAVLRQIPGSSAQAMECDWADFG